MDFFSGYGSDSDSEQPAKSVSAPAPVQPKVQAKVVSQVKVQPKVPALAPQVPSAGSSSSGGVVQKKVKKLDISFLPAEIQAALARGDSTRDSDDDEAGPQFSTKTSVNKSANKPVDATSSLLLGMLPAPKLFETENSAASSSSKSNNSQQLTVPLVPKAATKELPATKPAPTAAPKNAFSFGYSSTETVRTGQGKTGSVTVSVDSKPDVPVMPWFQDIQKPIEAVRSNSFSLLNLTSYLIVLLHFRQTSRTPAFAAAPAPQSFSSGLHASNIIHANIGPASGPSSSSDTQPARQSYQEYMQQTAAYSAQQGAQFEQPSQKKRKDRDFELQLMSGDLSGMQDAAVKDISVQNKWDELRYTEQQQQMAEVQRGFGIGVNKNLMQVSKQQNRKHQLSSLAIKAAETELAMLEKRGARNLTKSETQGKYGW